MPENNRYRELAQRLFAELKASRRRLARFQERSGGGVAIVGMAGRFPGGSDLGAFRERLFAGEDLVTRGRPDGLMVDGEGEDAAPWGAYVPDLDRFDARFFGIAPVEAELMDPQQRLLLEVSWEALEDAGVDPGTLRGSLTGVYAGIMNRDYERLAPFVEEGGGRSAYVATGTGHAAATGRVSFALGLQGPAIALDTACSSSLVAIHQAAAAVRQGEVELALAGGVNVMLSVELSRVAMTAGMLSPRGRCSTFDASADGYVRGEGCGMVVLKRLSDAERDGDRIRGVLLGSAVNQDGASAGFTVPNGPAQEAVIREALDRAGIEPSGVDYLEAHGTGTELGDPIEVQAAAAVYGEARDPERPLLLGSVKTNIGHLESAAGVAGVIKVLLSLGAGEIPRHLHFERPNPRIRWDELPVRVASGGERWPETGGRPRRAGVSSFGYSGTNAHLVLESYEEGERPQAGETRFAERRYRLLPLSGKSAGALSELAGKYRGSLTEESPLADVAWTAGVGRGHFGHRAGLVFGDLGSLREQLASLAGGVVPEASAGGGKVAFLYTGQGSQWAGMGRDLYEREPAVREVLDRCEEVIREERGASLLSVMFGETEGLDRTEWTQPALYALERALTALWVSVGVRPAAVLGHSVGALAAAGAAGVFDLESGLRFAGRRGELMGRLPAGGGMTAVFAPPGEVSSRLTGALSLAAENGAHAVVSGPAQELSSLESRFGSEGVRVERLATSHAFHSGLMDPVLDELESAGGEVSFGSPSVPVVSDVSGRVAGTGELEDAGYWRRQAREPVRFASGVQSLAELGVGVLVEVGPRAVLGPLAARCWPSVGAAEGAPVVVWSQAGMRGSGDEEFTRAVSSLYEAGLDISFGGLFDGERRRRVSLPTYPFQRERHWVRVGRRRRARSEDALLGERRVSASGEEVFGTEWSADSPDWLGDHRVFGRVVAPGALYGVQAAAAQRAAGSGRGPALVEGVRIERPLVLPSGEDGEGREVQVVLGAVSGASRREFSVYSRGGEEEDWVRHAAGRVGPGGDLGVPPLAAEARERLQSGLDRVEVGEFHALLRASGIRYGPSFRAVSRLWAGEGEALAELEVPSGLSAEAGAAGTVLLDAAFRTIGAVGRSGGEGPEGPAESGEHLWLPVGWERLWVSGELPERLWCHARTEDAPGGDGAAEVGSVRMEFRLFGEDGSPVGGGSGFRLRRATRAAIDSFGRGVTETLYAVEWREPPEDGEAVAEPASPAGSWVLWPGPGEAGTVSVLARELAESGQEVVTLGAGEDPLCRESWRDLFVGLGDASPLRGVVHLGGLGVMEDDAEAAALWEGVESLAGSALALLQGLHDAGARPALGVSLVTRGGQRLGDEGFSGFSGSVVWGLGRAAAREFGDVRVRLVDLDPGAGNGEPALADELRHPDREEEIAYRGGVRRVRRLVRLPAALEDVRERIRGDRSYLVTGGLGGLGLRVAGWLAERGAGAVVLNGRRAPGDVALAAIEKLRSGGTEIRVALADVTDGEAVSGMVSEAGAGGVPLGGVIHAAGVLSDRALVNQDRESFARVLGPKVLGGWNLHRATLGLELDLFVVFSSLAGFLGNAGQSNYAAANAWLEGLAGWRRSRGLAGQAIAWGAWSGSGEAAEARERLAARFASLGAGWLTPEQGLAALDRLVRADVAESAVAVMDWGAAPHGLPPLFDQFASAGGEAEAGRDGDLLERLRAAQGAEREAALVGVLREEVQSALGLSAPPAVDSGFVDLGMDSLMAVELRNRLSRALGPEIAVPNTVVFDYPDIGRLARHLAGHLGGAAEAVPAPPARLTAGGGERVAIVGMAARLPGGADSASFWRRLAAGADLVTRGRPDGLMVDGEGDAAPWGAYVADLDRFDAGFFGIAPVEAELMDPQQRLLLEVSWEALEDAGLDPGSLRGSLTGVYAGIMNRDYERLATLAEEGGGRSAYVTTGTGHATAIGRVSFALGLQGPAIAVDTACSSSLVAIHQAAAALRQGEAELALAGGVNVMLSAELSRLAMMAGMLSPRGRCSTFDASADGYVRGEGCGMVVLKRLSDAERDGDRILGVLLGSAVNQDGASAGFTAPNGPAQEAVIREALARAGVAASEVDYLEAHGTGTELGDPIEVQAAAAVYGEGRSAERPLLLGSVKTNIGHLESAAGVAGLIKVLLSLGAGEIPRHLHFERPNPRIRWDELPVRVVTAGEGWPEVADRPRRAGVSSFGYSGTNAHLVVEGYGEPVGGGPAAPEAGAAASVRQRRLLPLSGKSSGALSELAGRYRGFLTEESELADVAWTAGVGRSHFAVRAGLEFGDLGELREQLAAVEQGGGRAAESGRGKVAFLYTGQGSQWPGMGRALYEEEPVAREVLERCEAVMREERGESLLSVMFGEAGGLDRTEWTQPALYALQGALTALWASVGVVPDAVFGHSVGELAASGASGVFDLESGLRLASRRGGLMGSLPAGGGMAAVFAPVAEVREELAKTNARVRGVGLSLAAENGTHVVVSGPRRLVGSLRRRLGGRGVRTEELVTSHAFHSGLMDPALAELESAAGAVSLGTPSVPVVSGVSGRVASPGELEDGGYWRRQAREPVRFASALGALAELGVGVLVEIGPRAVLGPLSSLSWPGGERPAVVPSLSGAEGRGFASAVGGAYEAGLEIAFGGLFAGERRRRVSVPTYPFQRERHWVRVARRRDGGHPLLGWRRELPGGEVSFETSISAFGWLSEYRVFDQVEAPMSLFVAQALAAIRRPERSAPATTLEDFRVERPLLLPPESPAGPDPRDRPVQLVLQASGGRGSRSFAAYSQDADGESWVLHAAGRGGAGEPPPAKDLAGPALRRLESRLTPVSLPELRRRRERAGIRCGPSLDALVGLWSGAREALGEIELPEGLAGAGGGVHPALLDACFQVPAGMTDWEEASAGGGVWRGAGFEKFWVRNGLADHVLCHVRARGRAGAAASGEAETRLADLTLYGEDGLCVGAVRGFRLQPVRRSELESLAGGTDALLYEVRWRPSAPMRDANFLEGPNPVASREWDLSEILLEEGGDPSLAVALTTGLEAIARSYAARALDELGWRPHAGQSVDPEALRRGLKVVESQQRLFARLFSLLGEAGVLAPDEGSAGWVVLSEPDDVSPASPGDPERQAERLLAGHPGGAVEIALLRRAGAALADVLRGRRDGVELLFSGEPKLTDLYLDTAFYRTTNRVLADSVSVAARGLPDDRLLRVLEVGAGSGATTDAVLRALPDGRVHWMFTDVSAAFFREAEERLGGVAPSMEFRVLDIERDPGEQGFARHRYDLVLAANVLHATRDIGASLANCRRLLAPSGMLVALETVGRLGWWDLTFGLLEGWWRFDDLYRPDHALAAPPVWRRALADAGYEETAIVGGGEPWAPLAVPGEAPAFRDLPAAVLLARGPVEVRPDPGAWVIWPGDMPVAVDGLAAALERRGQTVVLPGVDRSAPAAFDPRRRESWRAVFAALPADLPLAGVLHLEAARGEAGEPAAGVLAIEVEEQMSSALALVQGLDDVGATPDSGVWFVTRGGQALDGEGRGTLSGSVLWGLGKVLERELPDFSPRLLDLDPESPGTAEALAAEVLFPDSETHIAHRGGRRLVARLERRRTPPDSESGPPLPAVLAGGWLREQRTWLVTGGLTGLGLRVAQWLAERGARAILLNGRRAPGPEAAEVIAGIRARGVDVRVERGDVTDQAVVDRLIACTQGAQAALPPLGGVVHCAGVFWDAAVTNHDWPLARRVLWPKVLGAWRLHQATADLDLDLFLLFSSATGVIGNAGQGAYAAANAFLDRLAGHRRALGLPGQAIAWGGWSGVGAADEARERLERNLEKIGFGWFPADQGIRALERLVGDGSGSAMVARMDWSRFVASSRAEQRLVAHLDDSGATTRAAGAVARDLLAELDGADESGREAVLVRFLQEEVQAVLRLGSPPAPEVGFFDLGVDSIMAVELRNRFQRALGGACQVPNTVILDYPTISDLASFLAERVGGPEAGVPAPRRRAAIQPALGERVAVVGMACRFPGGEDLEEFWKTLATGGHPVTRGRPDDLPGVDGDEEGTPAWGAYLRNLDRFDAGFFRIAPVEAEMMDPQQRLLLETSWAALENAGMDPGGLRESRTGLYCGISDANYDYLIGESANFHTVTGTSTAAAVGRVSFTLGLQGPAISVDTACSSSLVAIHQAVSGLRQGDADLVLAGGVNAILGSAGSRLLAEGGILSASGRCRTFDAAADGFVRGEGCGVLVLKRLEEAERDGDQILGVVLGSAVNHDGASAGLTVPNGPAQERVIAEALSRARIEADGVDYLEAHGTATELGDPIEVRAAASVYGEGRPPERPLLLGSVKTNVGHLEAAAGVAGVIKSLLALREGTIPKHLHFETPNPQLDWSGLPVRVTSEPMPWPDGLDRPSRSGVSSFGISGTNAHLILEKYGDPGEARGAPRAALAQAPAVPGAPGGGRPADTHDTPGDTPFAERRRRLLPLSARTGGALARLAGRYARWVDGGAGEPEWERFSNAAWMAGVGRSHFACRAGVVFSTAHELRESLGELSAGAPSPPMPAAGAAGRPRVAFLFTGQGSQWAGMGRGLYDREPAARAILDQAETVFREERGVSLLEVMFDGGHPSADLHETSFTQPALYALEGALVALWAGVGIVPDMVLGHSVGEVAAAQAAGMFGFAEGMRFIARRGALMGGLPREGAGAGGMLAVFAPLPAVEAALAATDNGEAALDVAAENGAHQVVSGALASLEDLSRRLAADGFRVARLGASHAFHSPLMEPILEEVESAASGLGSSPPAIPLVGNVSGRSVRRGEMENGAYWRRQARARVRFASGIGALAELGAAVLVEIGPRPVLGPMAALSWPAAEAPVVIASQAGPDADDDAGFLGGVAQAYQAGLPVSFAGLYAGERRRKIALPTYPFERERHWVKPRPPRRSAAGHPLLGSRRELPRGGFSFEMTAGELEWLPDHRVFGRVIAPGAVFATQALAALRSAVGPAAPGFVEDFRIDRALVLPEEEEEERSEASSRRVHVLLGEAESGGVRPVEVFSRREDETSWTLHAGGRVRAGTSPADGGLSPPELRSWQEGWKRREVADLYRALGAAGIELGPAFRGVRHLWGDGLEALGEVALPAGLDAATGSIHPALLDACFQVTGGVAMSGAASGPELFLPVGWERLWLAASVPETLLCHVRFASPPEGPAAETRRVDLTLYGKDGAPVGAVSGLTLQRTNRSALLSASTPVSDLLYELGWERSESARAGLAPADFLKTPDSAVQVALRAWEAARAAETEAETGEAKADTEGSDALRAGLEDLARLQVVEALDRLGWEPRAGDAVDPEALRRQLKIVEAHRRLFGRMLGMLAESGRLVAGGGPELGWRVAAGARDPATESRRDPEALADELTERYPEGAIQIALLRRCGAALPDVLRGRADGVDLLFSGTPSAVDLYREAPGYRTVNRIVGDAVAAAVAGLPEGARLRVLEVGAGAGGTTAAVLPKLPAERVDYTYTDISPAFFEEAEGRFGSSGAVIECRTLDIEREPHEQGFDLHAWHLVLAANVLHATRDLGQSLENCRRLLAPSGMLVVLEATKAERWLDLTFGLLAGWWRFEDGYRTDHALVGAPVWRRALTDSGYEGAAVLGAEDEVAEPAASSGGISGAVIAARAPAEIRPDAGLWVVWPPDGDAVTGGLVRELEKRGQRVASLETAASEGEAEPFEPWRRESWADRFRRLPAPLRGVLHLEGLAGSGGDGTTASLSADVTRVTRSALALLQGLYDAGTVPARGVAFVTRGGQVVDREARSELAGAALWGVARSAVQERLDARIRLLDLDPGAAPPFGRIVDELLFPDREPEMAWRAGDRLVPRLSRLPAGQAPAEGGAWRFRSDPEGRLDRLPIERAPAVLGPSDVRIVVEAAGLNFHDVLVGMGLVDSGTPLGSEVCGRVLEAGSAVAGMSRGDRVVGFAVGGFATEAVTRASLLAPAPGALPSTRLAAAPVALVTAQLAFDLAELEPGDRVLVHAGTGGVGHAAIRLAQEAGFEVYATASVPKQAYLRSLKVAGVFDSRSPDYGEAILDATGGMGVQMVLNSLAGDPFIEASLRTLATAGRFIEIGKRGIWSDERMAAERPDVRYRILSLDRRLIEDPEAVGSVLRGIMERIAEGALEPPPSRRWPLAEVGSAMEFMRSARHVGKIVLTPSAVARGALRADRSYLVTGGLGGVGLASARWLASLGAGSIVLNGRRDPDPDQAAAVDALRGQGAAVRVVIADVADPEAVDGMLAELAASDLPPLGGVIHGAGALSDRMLPNQDWESFQRVLAPKVLGAWNLHRATLDRDLDLFLLFSSFSGVVGSPGQSNHAAANAFLDQLARWRRARGLPGQAIAWGAWSGLGKAQEQRGQVAGWFAAAGTDWFGPEQGIAALSRLVRDDVAAGVVAAVDWEAAGRVARPLYEDLAFAASGADRRDTSDELRAALDRAASADRPRVLEDFLRRQVQSVLRLRSMPPPDVGFFDLGMDSLIAVELRNRVNRALSGAYVAPNTVVLDHPSIRRLAVHLAAQLDDAAVPEGSRSPVPETTAGGEPGRLQGLDEAGILAEAEALLDAD